MRGTPGSEPSQQLLQATQAANVATGSQDGSQGPNLATFEEEEGLNAVQGPVSRDQEPSGTGTEAGPGLRVAVGDAGLGPQPPAGDHHAWDPGDRDGPPGEPSGHPDTEGWRGAGATVPSWALDDVRTSSTLRPESLYSNVRTCFSTTKLARERSGSARFCTLVSSLCNPEAHVCLLTKYSRPETFKPLSHMMSCLLLELFSLF